MPERSGEPSHKPTPGRLRQARQRGEIPRSPIFLAAASLLSLPLFLFLHRKVASDIISNFAPWVHTGRLPEISAISWSTVWGMVLSWALVPWLFSLAAGILLNPRLTRRGRSFHVPFSLPRPSMQLGRVGAGLLFGAAAGLCLYLTVSSIMSRPPSAWDTVASYVGHVLWCVWSYALMLGVAAYGLAWHRYRRSLKMTLSEVRDETRREEGSPEMKSARRKRARE